MVTDDIEPVLTSRNGFPDQTSMSRRTLLLTLGAVCGLFCVINCAGVAVSESVGGPSIGGKVLIALGLGIMGGQMGALSAILVWSGGPFLVRLISIWLVAAGLYLCWLLGFVQAIGDDLPYPDMWQEVALTVAAGIPMISLAIQLPQWLLRLYFGWRVEAPCPIPGPGNSPLTIRDILIGTTLSALTVMALRLSLLNGGMNSTGFWLGWAIASAILSGVGAVINGPLLFLILRGRSVAWGVAYILLGSPLVVGAVLAILTLTEPGRPDSELVLLFMIVGTACVATTSIPMWIARLAGYRLKLGREL